MNPSKLFLIGALGLVALLATPTAQAADHRHPKGERHEYRNHGDDPAPPHHHPHSLQPKSVDDGYSNGRDVTIAFGGHVIHTQHYRH